MTEDQKDILIDDLRDALDDIIQWYAAALRDEGASKSDIASDGAICRARAVLQRAKEIMHY